MSLYEENLKEEIRKLQRKFDDQKQMNDKMLSYTCSGSCKKSDVEYLKAMLLVCLDLLEKSRPSDPEQAPEWLSRKVAVKTVIQSL
jgi:hypothetical protein